jgi:hypothetical protein
VLKGDFVGVRSCSCSCSQSQSHGKKIINILAQIYRGKINRNGGCVQYGSGTMYKLNWGAGAPKNTWT